MIRMRTGLDGSEEMTLEQIGQHFGITKERVRQINVRGMKQLREWAAKENVGQCRNRRPPSSQPTPPAGGSPGGRCAFGRPLSSTLNRSEEQTLHEPADREEPDRSQDADAKCAGAGERSQRRGFDQGLTGFADRYRPAIRGRESANPLQVNGVIESVALHQKAEFLNQFDLVGTTVAQTGLRHGSLAQCGPEGSAPGCVV